jgi:hypothetical protein
MRRVQSDGEGDQERAEGVKGQRGGGLLSSRANSVENKPCTPSRSHKIRVAPSITNSCGCITCIPHAHCYKQQQHVASKTYKVLKQNAVLKKVVLFLFV